jgi:hypothetical protein
MLIRVLKPKNLFWLVACAFAGGVVYYAVRVVAAPETMYYSRDSGRVSSSSLMMVAQCVISIAILSVPRFLGRVTRLEIPVSIEVIFSSYMLLTVFLGEVLSLYYKLPFWDGIMHTFSGAAITALGFSLVRILNRSEPGRSEHMLIRPLLAAVFAFAFSMALSVMWEIYEFTVDALLSSNTQRYMALDGQPFVGRAALADTMKDCILNTAGAFGMSLYGYFSLKSGRGWISRLNIRLRKRADTVETEGKKDKAAV